VSGVLQAAENRLLKLMSELFHNVWGKKCSETNDHVTAELSECGTRPHITASQVDCRVATATAIALIKDIYSGRLGQRRQMVHGRSGD
jgi:hypothetical protein